MRLSEFFKRLLMPADGAKRRTALGVKAGYGA
jgi:hypothetical protein